MASIAFTDTANTRRHAWIAPAALVIAHALFNMVADPFQSNNYHWAFMLYGGVFHIQPVLFAAWAAIGPAPAVKRIALALAAYAAILLGSALVHTYFHGPSDSLSAMVMMPALFIATFFSLLIIGKLTHWQIDIPSSMQAAASGGQFSLKFLMSFTAICAALLAAGRGLTWVEENGAFDFPRFFTMIGVTLMLLFPAFVIPLTALSARLTKRTLIVVPIVCLVFTVLAVVATWNFEPGADREMIGFVLLVQLGALLGGLVSALILRLNGYRLFRRNAA